MSLHLDYRSFEDDIKHIAEISDNLGEEWKVAVCEKTERLYLVKKVVIPHLSAGSRYYDELGGEITEQSTVSQQTDDEALQEVIKDEDVHCISASRWADFVTCDYHVIYNSSYEIPILFFNMHTTDGKLLPLKEIWQLIPRHHYQQVETRLWSVVSQAEHPILGRPFFHIHPCHTPNLMAKLCGNRSTTRRNYVLTWLSAVGRMVGLEVSSAYFHS